jgi:3-hydroxyacyl-[acyl-carrier-protein] dehydratase
MSDSPLNIEFVKRVNPLRYPVLLIDRILSLEPGEHVVALKNFSAGETTFGVSCLELNAPPEPLVIESMVQAAGLTIPRREGKYAFLAALDNVQFETRIQYGDTLITEATRLWSKGPVVNVRAEAKVNGERVISGDITYVYQDLPDATVG